VGLNKIISGRLRARQVRVNSLDPQRERQGPIFLRKKGKKENKHNPKKRKKSICVSRIGTESQGEGAPGRGFE